MLTMDQIVDGYMAESEIDYIALPQLSAAARRWLGAQNTEEARKLSLEIVRRLYRKGLRPGDYWGSDFGYWTDEGCQAVLDRIERDWIQGRRRSQPRRADLLVRTPTEISAIGITCGRAAPSVKGR